MLYRGWYMNAAPTEGGSMGPMDNVRPAGDYRTPSEARASFERAAQRVRDLANSMMAGSTRYVQAINQREQASAALRRMQREVV